MIPRPLACADLAEPPVSLETPQFLAHLMVIQDVVTVGASLHGLEYRRGINMTDAEGLEIVGEGGRVVEAEAGVQLDAIGGCR